MWDLLLKQASVVPNVYISGQPYPTITYNSLAKELWRLRVNFFALLVLLLASVGYVSPLASLHQFVTNPTLEEQNGTQMVQAKYGN